MRKAGVRCKECENLYKADLERCPYCGRMNRQGGRDLLLKWVAVLVLLIALACVAYLFQRRLGGN